MAGTAAFIVEGRGTGSVGLLGMTLARARFWSKLARLASSRKITTQQMRIVIKPELGGFAVGSSAATAPWLVEELIDQLYGHGYERVAVVAAPDSSTFWAENREVLALADVLGYRYATSAGQPYEVLDLSEDLVNADFPEGTLLRGSQLARPWQEADFRIVFAKNRTDEQQGYALCLDSLIGVLPLADKDYFYRHRFDPAEVVVELLRAAPVHFALIDAVTSCHGQGGGRAPLAISTKTLIASTHIVLADYAAALKMGIDPYVSEITRRAVEKIGLPSHYRLQGNLAPYAGWTNVHRALTDSTRKRDKWVTFSRTVKPWLQRTDPEVFPFKDPLDARLNATLASRVANLDGDAGALWSLILANYGVGALHDVLESYCVLYDKDMLRRRKVPLNLDLTAYQRTDYESARDLLDLAPLLHDLPIDESGLRWRYLEEAVLFEFSRTVPVAFRDFVAKVDVSRTIQFMNDYIGGLAVPVAHDGHGRVTHQAERNLYLQQPNYLVLYQGKVIDVTKLEYAEYGNDFHRMSWKTVKSENESARYDDGTVVFQRTGSGTLVRILGRQLFTLPIFWQAVNLDLMPALKSALVSQAYRTFFSRTLANLEALVEGRDIQLGRPWQEPEGSGETEPRLVERAAAFLAKLNEQYGDVLGRDLLSALVMGAPRSKPAVVDEGGFAHFLPSTGLAREDESTPGEAVTALQRAKDVITQLSSDLATALRQDLQMQSTLSSPGVR